MVSTDQKYAALGRLAEDRHAAKQRLATLKEHVEYTGKQFLLLSGLLKSADNLSQAHALSALAQYISDKSLSLEALRDDILELDSLTIQVQDLDMRARQAGIA